MEFVNAAVKDRVIEALDQLYLSGWTGNSFTSAQAAQNLLNLAIGATLGELGSLEEAIKCFAQKGLITAITMHELWDLAEKSSRQMIEDVENRSRALQQTRGALAVLSMATGVVEDTMEPHRIASLLKIAFVRGRCDPLTVRHACMALSKIGGEAFSDKCEAFSCCYLSKMYFFRHYRSFFAVNLIRFARKHSQH